VNLKSSVRVVLVDDHPVVRAGIETFLATAPEVDLVGVAAGGAEGVALVGDLVPDVVLMDLAMPGVDGLEATRRIHAAHPSITILVLTSFTDRRKVVEAFDAGAAGYLLKDAPASDLVRAIVAAANGQAPLDPRAARALLTARAGNGGGDFSPRELSVLRLLVEGRPNRAIAKQLGVSEATVKAHLTNIFQRIGVSDRTQAALWAERNGLGSP
jgi:DNA-binding NarL/FixJ family response regulator